MYNTRFQSVRLLDNQKLCGQLKNILHGPTIISKDQKNLKLLPIMNTLYINNLVSKRKILDTLYYNATPFAYETYRLHLKDKIIAWIERSIIITVSSFVIYAIACVNFPTTPILNFVAIFFIIYMNIVHLIGAHYPLALSIHWRAHMSKSIVAILCPTIILVFFSIITIF